MSAPTTVKSKVSSSKQKLAEIAGKIEETDEMKLKMLQELDKPDPDDILYPPELNAHLIDQLKIMTCENNELRKLIFTKDQEMKELNKTMADLNQRIRDIITGSGPAISSKSAGVISAKITDLCRQNRHLVAEVENYKTKNGGLEKRIMQLELTVKEREKFEPCCCKNEPPDTNTAELRELNTKLSVVNKKLYDSKNRNLELKNDILIATKILQQELGDKFTSIKELQNDLAGWKGRAQEIQYLKFKVSEYEEKLNGRKEKELKKEYSHTQVIRDIESKRKKEVDKALQDYENLKQDNLDLKKKLEGAKCRIRNLECDATTIRQKMQTFAEKSNHDDMLINEQRNEIKNLELYYQDILKENTAKMSKMHSEISEGQKLSKNTDEKIDALRRQANEKAAKIEELRAQLRRYEECSLQSVFFTPMRTATDNEIRMLSELVVKQNERLDSERHHLQEMEAQNRKLREKKKRLEKKIVTLEDEVKSLKEESSRRTSRMSKSSLPKEDLNFYGSGSSLKKKSSTGKSTSSESQQDLYEQFDKGELKNKLELTEERLKILEDRLKMIEEERSDDINNLTNMIQTSKQLFNEALAVLQREKVCICATEDN